MSFILDALKKAESERNRQSGPVLMDVRVAAPRRRLPGWAWVLGCVLLANLLVLAWLLLRTPAPKLLAGVPAAAPAATPQALAPPAVAPQVITPLPISPQAAVPAPLAGAPSVAASMPATGQLPPAPLPLPDAAVGVIAGQAPSMPVSESALNVDNLPTYQDLIADGIALPPLQLNLHVYDAAPANRYVLLNAMRLREGEFTPDGIKLERITPRGAVLDMRGRRFLLSAGG